MDVTSIVNSLSTTQQGYNKERDLAHKIYGNHVMNSSNQNIIKDIVKQDLERQYSIDAKTADRYNKYGISWNPTDAANGSLDRQLAERQSNWSKFGNMLAQSLVSEIGLGTLTAFTDIFDAIGNAISASDNDYQNPVSAKLEEWRETFRNDIAPIHVAPGTNISNGGLADFGWWMSNMPSVMSSLTLLIPSTAITKGVKAVAKGVKSANTSRKAAKFANMADDIARSANAERMSRGLSLSSRTKKNIELFAENGFNAALMRTMENYQEARQVYNDMYSETADTLNNMSDEEYANFLERNKTLLEESGANPTDRDAVAKAIAKRSADTTFKTDYANTVFDIIQLYALRNIPFHGFRNVQATTTSRALERNSRRFAGQYKTLDELKDLMSKRSKKTKFFDSLYDKTIGSGLAISAQLSEGAEEAINYIAQEEGMSVGHSLLGLEAKGTFNHRLRSYMSAPELWESAFWGVAGGVVFQGLGSAFNRAQTAIERKQDYKKRKANSKTGENVEKPTFSELWEQADKKRDEAEMKHRIQTQTDFLNTMEKIRNGENPYDPIKDEKGNPKKISNEEAAILAERAEVDATTSMALMAMDAGRMKQLRAYLESDEIRDAMAKQLNMSQEEAKEVQAKRLATLDKVEAEYEKQIKHLNDLSKRINQRFKITNGDYIPTEYLQLIARENINTQLSIDDFENQLSQLELSAAQEKAFVDAKLDPSINYKDQIRLNFLIDRLGQLEALKKAQQKDKESLKTVIGQDDLRRTNQQIEQIKDMIYSLNEDAAIPNLLFSIFNAANYEQTDKGARSNKRGTTDYLAIQKLIEEKNVDKLKELDKRLSDLTEANLQTLQVLDDNTRRLHSAVNGVEQVSPQLFSDYYMIAGLQTEVALMRGDLIKTEQELLDAVNTKHNIMNELRKKAIKDARESLKGVKKTYGSDVIRQTLLNRYEGRDEFDGVTADISDTDKSLIKNVYDILNLESSSNKSLYFIVDDLIALDDDVVAAQSGKSSTSENQKSEDENSDPTVTPQPAEESPSPSETPSVEPATPTETAPQTDIPLLEKIYLYEYGEQYAILHPTLHDSGTYYLEVNTQSIRGKELVRNDDYYIVASDASIMDDRYEIASMPVVERKEAGSLNVVKRGHIVNPTDDNLAAVERQKQQEELNKQLAEQERIAKEQADRARQEEAAVTAAFPSFTGDGEQTPVDDESPLADEDYENQIKEEIALVDKIQRIIGRRVYNYEQNEHDMTEDDWDDIRKDLIDVVANGDQNADVVSTIDKYIRFEKENYAEDHPTGVLARALVLSSRLREVVNFDNKKAIATKFNAEVEKLVEDFKSKTSVRTIDGITYINIESLARYCNNLAPEMNAGYSIYDNMLAYMANSKKYVLTDNNINSVKSNLLKSIKERYEELYQKEQLFNINFDGYYKLIEPNKQLKDRLVEVLDSLKPGDVLTHKIKSGRIVFDYNGTVVGYLPIPDKYKGNSDHKLQVNDGWNTDVLINSDGTVTSNLKELFREWVLNPNEDSDIASLYDIVMQYAFNSKANKISLLQAFEKNKAFIEARKNGFVDSKANSQDLLNGLSKLWGFIEDLPSDTSEESKEYRSQSIDKWFDLTVAPSFLTIDALLANNNASVVVGDITEGQRINTLGYESTRISPDDSRLNNPNVALSDRYKKDGHVDSNSVKLGATESVEGAVINHISGNVDTSKTKLIDEKRTERGNTFVILPTRNGQHEIVHAYPQRANSSRLSSTAKQIVNSCKAEISRILEDDEVSMREKMANLKTLMNDLIGGRTAVTTPLFTRIPNYIDEKGKAVSPILILVHNADFGNNNINSAGFTIKYRHNEEIHTVKVWPTKEGIKLSIDGTLITDVKEISQTLFDTILNNSTFNIGFNFIELDNNSLVDLTGIIRKDKSTGEIVIQVGQQTPFRFSSYNDFVLQNGVVALNTKTNNEGSNFERFPEDGRAKQILKVRVEASATSPLKRNGDETSESNPTTISTPFSFDDLNKILNNKRIVYKGKAIAAKILGTTGIAFNNRIFDIFPKNIVFLDQELGDNAMTNVGTNVATVNGVSINPGEIVIGREWLAMATSSDKSVRLEAVRKLIHEQLHLILHKDGNEKYIERLRTIFDEFANKNTNPDLEQYLFNTTEQNRNQYWTDGKLNEEGLEEFLVETLTSSELAQALNSIIVEETINDKKEKKSLLQKMMEWMLDLFNWTDANGNPIKASITSGSLYEKEFKLLADAFENNDKPTKTKPKPSAENQLKLDFSTQSYVKTENDNTPKLDETEQPDRIKNNRALLLKKQSKGKSLTSIRKSAMSENYDYTEEMQQIKDKAIADGTFMQAPNGNPTNLNERQWLQVRTKAFKDWFGDWELNGITVEKRGYLEIDRGEYIIKRYGNQIGEFSIIEDANYPHGIITWVNLRYPDDNSNKGYGKKAYIALNRELNRRGVTLETMPDEENTLHEYARRIWNNLVKDGLAIETEYGYRMLIDSSVSKVVDENGEPLVVYHGSPDNNFTVFDTSRKPIHGNRLGPGSYFTPRKSETTYGKTRSFFLNIKNPYLNETTIPSNLKEQNYDGIFDIGEYMNDLRIRIPDVFVIEESEHTIKTLDEIVVFNPNQIKSATDNNGEFSKTNNDIRRSSISETKAPSSAAFVDRFRVESQAKIRTKLNNGEITMKCK